MKLHHATAVALVGWYLMVPPITNGSSPCPPISQWKIQKSFDTASACARELSDLQRPRMDALKNGQGAWDNCSGVTDQGSCVAADDPRLKAK